jgi:hypothetical protein
MTSDKRTRLIHRTGDLRRLFEVTTDSRARVAINAEIDNKAPEEFRVAQQEEIVAARRDIIS